MNSSSSGSTRHRSSSNPDNAPSPAVSVGNDSHTNSHDEQDSVSLYGNSSLVFSFSEC